MDRFRWRGLLISDSFAEAFSVTGTRLIVTAISEKWASIAASEVTGYGTSVIACDAEAGIDQVLSPDSTPDGRPGVALMFFAFNQEALQKAIIKRVGQCLLTCPTTAVYDGICEGHALDLRERLSVGSQLRYFGDGYQASKVVGETRYWRIPVMDGEFVCEESIHSFRGVAGGNLLIGGKTIQVALKAAEAAVVAMSNCPGIIMPFPGGIVRSGSKVGSKYSALRASTNDAYCPTLKPRTKTDLLPETEAVYEIVIDGDSAESVSAAMKLGLTSLTHFEDITEVSAGNYGGKLGKHHFHLRELTQQIDNDPT